MNNRTKPTKSATPKEHPLVSRAIAQVLNERHQEYFFGDFRPVSASQAIWIVIAASLGYLVDLFDTFLLPALRAPTLRELGVGTASSLTVGTNLFNLQLLGQTLGALFFWGPLSDKFGRKKVLFASILIYGLANVATAASHSLAFFAVARFVAGIGLGGELGAGIALISESLPIKHRTTGTMIVGTLGMFGVVLAGLLAQSHLSWRTDYVLGGVLAAVVLAFRFGSHESRLFQSAPLWVRPPYWDIFRYLIRPLPFLRFLGCILVGAPTFFVVGLLVSGAPEFGKALGMVNLPNAADALVWTYTSISLGGLGCGAVALLLRSRRNALLLFHAITAVGFGLILFYPASTPDGYYWRCALAGFGVGYWANMVTNAAEQWGLNLRGTITISVPNFVRLLLFPIYSSFLLLRNAFGFTSSAAIVGFVCSALAIISVLSMPDGFCRNLKFTENLKTGNLQTGLTAADAK
jgi:MFS transporter, putative metabolite:H+ symporter